MGNGGGCGLCRCINSLITLAFLGAGGYLIWHFLGRPDSNELRDILSDAIDNFGDFGNVLGNITDRDFGDLFNNDPFVGDNSTNQWRTNGEGGLELEILNALDDTWQSEFALAVDDWENGNPDPLTLQVTRGEVDYSCKQRDGLQKVCAGNFGETGWLGINEMITVTSTGEIISSVAKMNEYYLRNADNAKRQYTMCHEIGHGFGLPHTDENFNNPPLGNCMDYTNQPSANMHPDITNFRRLASLYGTVNRRKLGAPNTRNIRNYRRLSEDLQMEYENAVTEIEQFLSSKRRNLALEETTDGHGWEAITSHSHGSSFMRSLGNDYYIEAHLLHDIPSTSN